MLRFSKNLIFKSLLFTLVIFLCLSNVAATSLDDLDYVLNYTNNKMNDTMEKVDNLSTKLSQYNNSNTGNWGELTNIIQSGSRNIYLTKDYKYSGSSDGNGITINISNLVIDGQGHIIDGSKLTRIFNVAGSNVTIKNIIFINGNVTTNGGSVYWKGVNGSLLNSYFINNSASNYGGSVYWSGVKGVLSNCIFVNNSANYGGGVYWTGVNGSLLNSYFLNNSAYTFGGGGVYWTGINGTLWNSSFLNNYGRIYGGGVYWKSVNGSLLNSFFLNNSASNYGGGAVYWSNSAHYGSLLNSFFVNNSANSYGGGVIWSGNSGILSNSYFLNNNVKYYGGSLYLNGEKSNLFNSTFIGNSINLANAIYWGSAEGTLDNIVFIDISATINVDKNSTLIGEVISIIPGNTVEDLDASYVLWVDGNKSDLNMSNGKFEWIANTYGNHIFMVEYLRNSVFNGSNSTRVTVKVDRKISGATINIDTNYTICDNLISIIPGNTVGDLDASYVLWVDGNKSDLNMSNGKFEWIANSGGNHNFIVEYLGNNEFGASNSTNRVVFVDKKLSNATISVSIDSTIIGDNVLIIPGNTVGDLDASYVLWVDGNKSNLIVSDSVFKWTANGYGNHTFMVEYRGNSEFNASNSSVLTVFVDKKASTSDLSFSVDNVVIGDTVVITPVISPKDVSGYYDVFVNGVKVTSTSISLSTSYTLTPTNVGVFNLSIVYSGDANYNGSTSSNKSITVYKKSSNTTISVDKDSTIVGDNVVITPSVNITDSNPTYVLWIDGNTSDLVIDNGVFNWVATTYGNHSFAVEYLGNGEFNASNSSSVNVMVYGSSSLVVSVNPSVSTLGLSIYLNTNVYNTDGVGISGGNVTYTFSDGSSVVVAVGSTYTFVPRSVGSFVVNASFSGFEYYLSSSGSATYVVNPVPTPPTPVTKDSALSYVIGEASVVLTLSSTDGVISNAPVGVSLNGTTSVYTTNNNGTINIDLTNLNPGVYNVIAIYYGDSTYNGCSRGFDVVINANETKDTNLTYVLNGDNLVLTLVAGDELIVDAWIIVSLNDISAIYITNNTGSVNINLTSLNPGVYNLTALYVGNDTYNGCLVNFNVNITNPTIINKTSISLNISETMIYGESNGVSGILVDSQGKAVIGHHVTVTLTRLSNGASKDYTVTTDYNGKFILPINLGAGYYSVKAVYNGELDYESCESELIYFNIVGSDMSTYIVLNTSEIMVFGEGNNVAGVLFYGSGKALIGHHVVFTMTRLTSGASKTYTVTTDYLGSFILPINLSPGSYSAKVTYSGELAYKPCESETRYFEIVI